jgi:hypothetical protein
VQIKSLGKKCAGAFVVAVAALASSASAQTAPASERVDRLTDLVVQLMPMGQIMEIAASRNPSWPLMAKASNVTPEQLACIRGQLGADKYRAVRQKEVEAYLKANPSRYPADVEVLQNGAAKLLGQLMMAGANSAVAGKEADPATILKSANSAQLIAMTSFVYDPKFEPLRQMTGLGDMFSTKGGDDNRKRGEGLGATVITTLTLKALDTCQVPPSVIF